MQVIALKDARAGSVPVSRPASWEEHWQAIKEEVIKLHKLDQQMRAHDEQFLAALSDTPAEARYQADGTAFSALYRRGRLEVATKELQDAVFEVARNVFGNGVSQIGIDPYDYSDHVVSGHDDEDFLNFNPVALWNAIRQNLEGDAGTAIANRQLAEALVSKLIAYQEGEVPERKGKFILIRHIHSGSVSGGWYRLSYSSGTFLYDVLDMLVKVALLSELPEAAADAKCICNQALGLHSAFTYRSRDAFSGQFGEIELAFFKEHVEFRLSPRFADALNVFVTEHSARKLSEPH